MQEVFMLSLSLNMMAKCYILDRFGLRFLPHIVHVELFCHKLIFGFLCQQVSVESLNLRQVTHFYIQLQRDGCV